MGKGEERRGDGRGEGNEPRPYNEIIFLDGPSSVLEGMMQASNLQRGIHITRPTEVTGSVGCFSFSPLMILAGVEWCELLHP